MLLIFVTFKTVYINYILYKIDKYHKNNFDPGVNL
jgi:hypothetical protein